MAKKKTTRPRPKMAKKKKAVAPKERRHDFPKVDDLEKIASVRDAVKKVLSKVLGMDMIKTYTSRIETIRSYLFNINKHDPMVLPFNSHGVGWTRNDKVRCLYAEVSCLVLAFWKFADDPTEPNGEEVNDFLEYIDALCEDQGTITTIDMGKGCRWRISNDHIMNGFKMPEI